MPSTKQTALILSAFTIAGFGVAVAVGTALLLHPPKPDVIEKTIAVEKPVPCPATKTGPATAKSGKGGTSVAHSGNGDTFNPPSAPNPAKQ